MIRRPPRSTPLYSSAASDVYKRQDQDPMDAAIRAAGASATDRSTPESLVRFVPFDPATKMSEAFARDDAGNELRVIKGAFEVITKIAEVPADARHMVDQLAEQGNRVIAVAAG